MNIIKNAYPYNYFDFEYSQSVLNEYDLTSNKYFILRYFHFHFFPLDKYFDNLDTTDKIVYNHYNREIILSYLEIKSLNENIKQIHLDLKQCNNQKQLELTYLNFLNRFEYYKNNLNLNIDNISRTIFNFSIFNANLNYLFNENNISINDIKKIIIDYFEKYIGYEIIYDTITDTLNSLKKFYNIDCYLSNEFDIYLTSEIDLYNSTNNNSLNNEPETPNNTNADIGVTGEHKLSLKETKLLNETKLNYFAQIIKEYSNDNTTSYKNDCEIFTNYCNSKGIQNIHIRNKDKKMNAITLSNNSDKYGINNKNNIELTTLIHNILKNAF